MLLGTTSSFPNVVTQGVESYSITGEDVVPSSIEANSAAESHPASLLYGFTILKEKVHQVQSLVSILISPGCESTTSYAVASMNTAIQEIVMTATAMMFNCQQIALGSSSGTASPDEMPPAPHHCETRFPPPPNPAANRQPLLQGFYPTDTLDHWYGDTYNNCSTKDENRRVEDLDALSPKNNNCDIIELNAADLLAKYTHYCKVCGKGFKRDANLRMHMRAHGDEYKTSRRTVFSPPDRGEDYTILQALFSVDMLILCMSAICGVGGTLTAIDNMGQIGSSYGYPKQSISTFVSLVSIWNYLGRVASGFVSEIVLQKYKFPRPLILTLILLLSCAGHLLIAFNVPNGLYVASVIIGFCFGAQVPLIFAIISELFGLKYYSTLYNFGSVASPIGLYLLNVRVTGHLYDKEAEKQMAALGLRREAGKELTCSGVECFKLSFIIITAVTVLGVLVSLILVLRTSRFYKSDIYKKFREQAKEAETEMAATENGAGQAEAKGG